MRRLTAPLVGFALVLTSVPAVLATAGAGPASAAPAPTEIALTASTGYADDPASLEATLTSAGAPVADREVAIQRRVDGAWTTIVTTSTDAQGGILVTATRRRDADDNAFRARFAGDTAYAESLSQTATAGLRRRSSELGLRAPAKVRFERRVELSLRWRTGGGQPVAGPVNLQRRGAKGGWTTLRTVRTGDAGRAAVKLELPAGTTGAVTLRAQAPALDWVDGARSPVRRVAITPPGEPVRFPRGTPRPRITLPAQPAAVGTGANAVITPIPDAIWAEMVGVSWHQGCPVGRTGLRLLRINYWGFDGYRHRGELVAATTAVDNMARALADMQRLKLPIRAMYRVDRFGYNARLRGGDDYKSMAADNTSAFNCRSVVNRPGVRSPHASGRALDVNTWENPYRSATGPVPNSYWLGHSHPRVAWRSASHPVVRAMARQGLRWTYGNDDAQHFDVATGAGRVIAPRRVCGPAVCH